MHIRVCGRILIASLPMFASAAFGQTARSPDTGNKLETPISVSPGPTTLGALLSILSAETGMKIVAADYLSDHKLVVQAPHTTAGALLNGLASVNEWRWSETQSGTILVEKATLRLPRSLADVGTCLRASLPRDLRSYLGLEARDAPDADTANAQTEAELRRVGLYPEIIALPRTTGRLSKALLQPASLLAEALLGRSDTDRRLPVADMSPAQRSELLSVLVLGAFKNLFSSSAAFAILSGQVTMFERDPGGLGIALHDGGLEIGFTDQGNVHRAFGGSVRP